jgi:hypothetical protein
MGTLNKQDLSAILLTVGGVASLAADTGFKADLIALFGPNVSGVLAVMGLVGLVSAQIVRVISNPSITTPAAEPQKPQT